MSVALQESEQRSRLLEAALDQAVLPVAITNADADDPHFVWTNPAFARLTGHPEEDLVGASVSLLHGLKTNRMTLENQLQALRVGRSFVGDLIC